MPTMKELAGERHTVRAFLPDPVPRQILEECLGLAQRAPSNSNIQPWRVVVLEGAAKDRVSAALLKAVEDGIQATTLPIPDPYKCYRSEMGHALYGSEGYGIAREDKEKLETARRRNYEFFGAPMAMIVSMDSRLAPIDTLSVGMYLQTLYFLLAERGIACSWQVSVAGYPTVLRETLGIEEHMGILCGVAIGYEDKRAHINGLRIPRDDWRKNLTFCTE